MIKRPKPSWEQREPKYTVETRRIHDSMHIYVSDGHSYLGLYPYYSKTIPLHRRWWHFRSPAERIRAAHAKAQSQADKLNHRELYLKHEAEIAEREP